MRIHTLSPLAALLLAAAAADAAVVTLSPSTVEAGAESKVTVSGKTELCMPIWTYQSVKESGGILTFEAAGQNNPTAKCTAGPHDFSLDFRVPPLKAGSYEARFQRRLPCEMTNPKCEPFIFPDSAGTFTVVDRAKAPFSIQPRAAAADKSFDLFLTSKDFTCGNTFTNLSVAVRGGQINLAFTNKVDPLVLCPAIEKDYGPTFKVPALKAGVYQVSATVIPYCAKEPCGRPNLTPQFAGSISIGSVGPGTEPWTEPGLVPAGMTFGLELHGPYDCNDVVTDKQVEVRDGKIYLRYGLMFTKKMCVDTVFVHHEVFTVPGLAVGDYPVILSPQGCTTFNHFLCKETVAPRVIDTVTASSSLGLKPGRAGKAALGAPGRNGIKVLWRGAPTDLSGRRQD